jgi:RNA polymerase sigma factor (sigma-70 family)
VWRLSDEALLAGFAAGDAETGAALVRRFQARVYGLAYSILGDRASAEDVAQEAFARAFSHADAYDPRRGTVATWLLVIARNLALDRVRARRAVPLDPQVIAYLRDAPAAEDPRMTEALPDALRLREAVGSLPEEQRRALLLAAVHGLTAREIGELDGTPLGTVKTRIRNAMLKLRAELEVGDGR